MGQKDGKRRGFTIIEVVLVLAIAGLIFAMVFVALPAMQRSQRDTQRRRDVQRVATNLVEYRSRNKGRLPWSDSKFMNADEWLSSTFMESVHVGEKFVQRYVDPEADSYNALELGSVEASGCTDQFRSPNGNCYILYPFIMFVDDHIKSLEDVDFRASFGEEQLAELKDAMMVMVGAECGHSEGWLSNPHAPNVAAVMTLAESGALICADTD